MKREFTEQEYVVRLGIKQRQVLGESKSCLKDGGTEIAHSECTKLPTIQTITSSAQQTAHTAGGSGQSWPLPGGPGKHQEKPPSR
jgi:hypothetical protein